MIGLSVKQEKQKLPMSPGQHNKEEEINCFEANVIILVCVYLLILILGPVFYIFSLVSTPAAARTGRSSLSCRGCR